MSEILTDAKNTNIELTHTTGITLSNTDSRIKHTGTGTLTIDSVSGGITIGNTTDVTFANDLLLDNSSNNTQYMYLNYDALSTNRWRFFVNSSGQLSFERYNGTTWVNKMLID